MKPQTIATLKQLEASIWFLNVGKLDSKSVSFVSNWGMAIQSCCSPDWENLCLDAVNQYCARVEERAPERLRLWNELTEEIKAISIPLVKEKIAGIVTANDLPNCFEDTVQWDILNLCMESEYSDVYPPGFYASQAYWYSKGHFPCGWQGQFPTGALIVF
jgi:hypothetical protein